MAASDILKQLKQSGQVWSGGQTVSDQDANTVPTGYPELDKELPGGGWPMGAVTEIIYPVSNIGELRIVLACLSHEKLSEGWQVWLNPPAKPHGPGLCCWRVPLERTLVCPDLTPKETGWALDQCVLERGACAVLAWVGWLDPGRVRRIQLAAAKNNQVVFLFRPENKANDLAHSRLKIRMKMYPPPDTVKLDILKRRTGWPIKDMIFPVPVIGPAWRPEM